MCAKKKKIGVQEIKVCVFRVQVVHVLSGFCVWVFGDWVFRVVCGLGCLGCLGCKGCFGCFGVFWVFRVFRVFWVFRVFRVFRVFWVFRV